MSAALVTTLVPGCPLDEKGVQRVVAAALAYGGRTGLYVGVVLASDKLMGEVHGKFLSDSLPTDVISFDLGAPEWPGGQLEGDESVVSAELFVGVEYARRVAQARGVEWARELALYITHGVLHLCGFDDQNETDSVLMRAAETEVMDSLGYAEDDLPHHM